MHVLFLQKPATHVNQERLAAGAEKCLGVNATARNWRTVEKICEMLGESA